MADSPDVSEKVVYEQWTMLIVRIASCSALFLHVWEWASYWTTEYRVFWTRPSSRVVRWPYYTSRYLGVLVQICDIILMTWVHSMASVPRRVCIAWYSFQIFTSVVFVVLLEITMSQRLYGLYKKDPRIARSCVLLITCGACLSMGFGALSLRKGEYSDGCVPGSHWGGLEAVGSSAAQSGTLAVLWMLLFHKRRQRSVSGFTFVIKDVPSIFAILPIIAGVAFDNILVMERNTYFDTAKLPLAIFPFYITFINTANCRQIVDMEDSREREGALELQGLDGSNVGIEEDAD